MKCVAKWCWSVADRGLGYSLCLCLCLCLYLVRVLRLAVNFVAKEILVCVCIL